MEILLVIVDLVGLGNEESFIVNEIFFMWLIDYFKLFGEEFCVLDDDSLDLSFVSMLDIFVVEEVLFYLLFVCVI